MTSLADPWAKKTPITMKKGLVIMCYWGGFKGGLNHHDLETWPRAWSGVPSGLAPLERGHFHCGDNPFQCRVMCCYQFQWYQGHPLSQKTIAWGPEWSSGPCCTPKWDHWGGGGLIHGRYGFLWVGSSDLFSERGIAVLITKAMGRLGLDRRFFVISHMFK